MPSRHSTLAPQQTVDKADAATPPRPLRALAKSLAARPWRRPKRDALTRVRHDLRSLVHSVVGYSDLLAQPSYGHLTPEQARFVSHVRSAAEHLQELVDTCIELSRPDNDQFAPELLEAPFGQVARRLRNNLVVRGLMCDLSLCSTLEGTPLRLDIAQLERAIIGLALVFTREGAVTMELHAEPTGRAITMRLRACDAEKQASEPVTLEQLEDQVGNRDFVRLKLSEVLLSRADAELRVSPTLDGAVIVLHV